ncbi:hypothetical protein RJ640_026333 [Escallonia rubra]|uniref:Methyltransferase n=1 Tax=Escallonia rubra TaxID=112253 RepID=A0AA88RHL3_9ASTE|nr:hypothetical protein RJ640_026333 [Escallonia rubra]
MAISVQNLLKERKYPFLFALLILLIFATFTLLTNTQSPIATTTADAATDLNQSQPKPIASSPPSDSNPTSQLSSQNSAVSPNVDAPSDMELKWRICDGAVAVDYIPCLDNFKAIKALKSRRHMEHRERHCPRPSPRCLIPLPPGYKVPVPWPKSRDMIWFNNVPHPKLVEYKKDQNWVRKDGDYLVFPGGGTQFKDGVNHYIDYIEKKTVGGKPLMELNRILRPGGFFIWSATPVYRNDERDRNVWNAMVALTEAICWKAVAKTFDSSGIGLVIYQKPASSSCYEKDQDKIRPLCDQNRWPNSSWYVPLDSCLPPLPRASMGSSFQWPAPWPERLSRKPPSLPTEPDAEEIFYEDTKHWASLVSDVYLEGLAINWSSVRNVMDMNAGYGGFAAALINLPLWVMNVIPISGPDTLPVIFDRGLIGIYHDWCESFNTYPRTYDLLHSSFLFRNLSQRCDIIDVAVEMDRILRPGGFLLVQDTMEIINKLSSILHSLHWSITVSQNQFLVGKKGFWRPDGRMRI